MAHKSYEELDKLYREAESLVAIRGIYQHFKGNSYIVDGFTFDKETDGLKVTYRPLAVDTLVVWSCPLEEFIEVIDVDSTSVNRYQFTGQFDVLQGPAST